MLLEGSIDLTAVFYTANTIPRDFAQATRKQLLRALGDTFLIEVPLPEGWTPSHFNIYRQALMGAKQATTPYIALVEDDVLYSPAHFKYRPKRPGVFAYNLGAWSIFTWSDPPLFTHKGVVRRNLNSLICERELFIEAMEERFARHPNPEGQHMQDIWAEPGKYERQLRVTQRQTEEFYTNPPNIVFSHQTELSYAGLGTRKRVGEFRALEIDYWGRAEDIRRLYG